MWAVNHNGGETADSRPAAAEARSFVTTPISLPPPIGAVRRVRPMQTALLIDTSVPASFPDSASFADEIQAAAAYMQRHGVVGDGISIGESDVHRLSTDARLVARLASSPPVAEGDPAQSMQAAVDRLAAFPDDDRLIVVLTNRPADWTAVAQSTSGVRDLSLSPADQTPAERMFIIDISPSSTARGLGSPPHSSPSTLTASPDPRGSVARGIAQAWVAGFDGGWPTG